MRGLDPNHPLSAILTGALDGLRVRRQLGPLSPGERLDGLTALVTGGASGLGFATSVDLARRGARVLLADVRAPQAAVARAVALGVPAGLLEPLQVDLSDLAAVDALVAGLKARGARLDRVVFNAAIVPLSARTTRQGLDEMLTVNYLAPFALATGLLDAGVVPRGGPAVPRLVFVASEAHRWGEGLPLDALDAPRDGAPGKVMAWYGVTKRLLTTFAWELARRLTPRGRPEVAVHALCPGAMRTGIARELPGVLRAPLDAVMRLTFQDPFDADEPVLYLCCSQALEGRTAVYLHKLTEKAVDPRAADPATGQALWERSQAVLERARRRG